MLKNSVSVLINREWLQWALHNENYAVPINKPSQHH